jgi:membrane-associated phospholipid phosphatase
MSSMDDLVTEYVTKLAGHSAIIDKIIVQVLQTPTFRLLPLMLSLVWFWNEREKRPVIVNGLAAGFVTLFFTRFIQNIAPHRPRPLYSGNFDFAYPTALSADWSSFPSDTAALAFALATTVWIMSRKMGILAMFWSTVVVSFPRLYTGAHYLSDIVGGAIIGISCVLILSRWSYATAGIDEFFQKASSNHLRWFHVVLVSVAFEITTYFEDIRKPAAEIFRAFGIK